MKCPNCGKGATKVFDAIPCCEDCFELANAACRRAATQMQSVLVLHREMTRVMMADGKLGVGRATNFQDAFDRIQNAVPSVQPNPGSRPGS